MSKKRITIFTAETGHLSIAQALVQALKPAYQVQLADVSSSLFSIYGVIYQYFPQVFTVPFRLGQLKQAQRLVKGILNRSYRLKIADILATQRPDIVISTYCLANPVLETYQKKVKFPFINIVTDPSTFHILVPSQNAVNLVFDQAAKDRGIQYGFPAASFQVSGWFVRQEYQPAGDKAAIRQQLSLSPDKLTLLVAAGSEGTNFVLKILPTFLQSPTPLNVVFSCGHNQQLFSLIKQLDNVNQRLRHHSAIRLVPLKFTDKLYRYMQASDLIIGKAGPNLIFEAVATHTPFFAITHIAGQEDGNLDLIKTYHLGYVEENPLKANRLLQRIVSHPDELAAFQPALQQLSAYNLQAPAVLQHTIQALLR